MFYDGILTTIISKKELNHKIVFDCLNYLKQNNKTNAKVLTLIPRLIFSNLEFLKGIDDYLLINIKASCNEFKREIDLKKVKEVLNKYNITFYGVRTTIDSMQIFTKNIDKKLRYKIRKELAFVSVLSISDRIIIYESNDIFTTDLANNDFLTNFIIINSANNYTMDVNNAYLGEITNINSAKNNFDKMYDNIYYNNNFYADITNYLYENYDKDITSVILSIIPEYNTNKFNDYYNRIYTLIEGPLYMVLTDGLKLDVVLSKDNNFDVYIGYNDDYIYITNKNMNLFDVNNFFSIKNFIEIDLDTKTITNIKDKIDSLQEKNNELFIIEDGVNNYESVFDLNEELIEICKDNVSYPTFLNGLYPSVRRIKLDSYYTTRNLSKSIYFKNVFLSLSEYENILNLKNNFNICYLMNNDLTELIKNEADIIILDDNDFLTYDSYDFINNSKKTCFILISEKYRFSDFAYYLSCGISLIYPYKAYMLINGFIEKKILDNNAINTYTRYLKNNISKVMSSYGIHYISSFVSSNLFNRELKTKKIDKIMLVKLEEALKSNSYDKYLEYSAYLNNSFTYKDEIDTNSAVKKEYIKSLFKCVLPVSKEVRKYLNSALSMDITTLDKRFIQDSLTNEIFIDFTDDSKNISLTDLNMYKAHKIIPNTPFIGIKYYFDIYSFKDLEALILELKEMNKNSFIIVKIKDISNIVDYITSGVDEIILDDINLLNKADKLLKELNLRDYILLSLEYDYYNSYDIINAAINGSNRFYFKKSILIPLGCMNYNKCYKCPNGIFGDLKYYGNDIYLNRFIDFLSYETYVSSSLIGFNSFSDKKKNYLIKEGIINDLITKNATSGITDISCNANLEDNIGCSIKIDKNVFVRINGNVGYNFGSYIKKNISLSLNGTAQKYLGKCLNGGSIYVYNNMINNLDDDKNYLVGKNALYKADSGKVFIDGYASNYFAFCNNGATAIVLGMDDYGCSYMTNGTIICLGDIGNNFAYNMTGGIAYIYGELDELDSKIDKRFVEISKIDGSDLYYLSTVLEEFSSITNSKRAKALAKFIDPDKFIKVVPKNYNIMTKKIEEFKRRGLSLDEAIIEVNKLCEK